MMLLVLLACPLVGAGALAAVRALRLAAARAAPLADAVHLATSLATAGSAAVLAFQVARSGPVASAGWGFRADGLSAFMAAMVAGIALVAAVGVPSYLAVETAAARLRPDRALAFRPLFHLFVFTMLLAVTTDNIGVTWVAIEGTTLASVFLITLERTRASLEAAYKYLLICSVGIAVAFIGTVLVYYADVQEFGETDQALYWSTLLAVAPQLPARLVELAFVFVLIGYGTKAGLVPMHTWLPDAHSEAPAPVSALMSGVLLNVGVYALLRFKTVADATLGAGFAGRLLLGFGLASMAVAAASLWAPRNYKRMLAYSSVEHIGLVCVGLSFGGAWGVAGALLHMLNHALAKSALFVLAGRVLQRYGSAELARVRGIMQAMPWTGAAFLAATLALVGLPPFGLFLSEVLILRAGFGNGQPWAAGVALALLVAVFGGVLRAVNRMLHGPAPAEAPGLALSPWPLVPVAINLALLVLLGAGLPAGLVEALTRIAAGLGG
jgi:hydrogenase-4 component F